MGFLQDHKAIIKFDPNHTFQQNNWKIDFIFPMSKKEAWKKAS